MEQPTFDAPAHETAGFGLCACGCGRKTNIAKNTHTRSGHVKGQPVRYIVGHTRRLRIDNDGRQCGTCRQYKPWDEFFISRNNAYGHMTSCRPCATEKHRRYAAEHPEKVSQASRNWSLSNADRVIANDRRRRFRIVGISEAEMEELLAAHGGVCEICGGAPDGRWRELVIDHDHVSGSFRGLLCSRCNLALGGFRDSPDLLRSAINYLMAAASKTETNAA
jgi:Recombination endonuclease VII